MEGKLNMSEYRKISRQDKESFNESYEKFLKAKEEFIEKSRFYNLGYNESVIDFLAKFKKEVADDLEEVIIFVNGKITEVMSLTEIKNFYEFMLPYSNLKLEKTMTPICGYDSFKYI